MLNYKNSLIVVGLLMFISLSSCTVEPKDIQYGNVHCHHCDMTVVDKSHAAQYVTSKGRAYFFDAIECMVGKLNQERNEDEMAFILVADYSHPGELIDADKAYYVVSKAIKSPMGANLSAFGKKNDAETIISENTGILYSWNQLKLHLND